MNGREELEKQFELMYVGKSQSEMIEIGAQIARDAMAKEKQEIRDKVGAIRAIYNVISPSVSRKPDLK